MHPAASSVIKASVIKASVIKTRVIKARARELGGFAVATVFDVAAVASGVLKCLASRLDALAARLDGLSVQAPLGSALSQVIAGGHAAQVALGQTGELADFFAVFIGVGVEQLSHKNIMTRGCDSLDLGP